MNKKIVCIVFGFSAFTASISMEKPVNKKKFNFFIHGKKKQVRRNTVHDIPITEKQESLMINETIADQVQRICKIAEQDIYDEQEALLLGNWLLWQRNNRDDELWPQFLKKFYKAVNDETCRCLCPSKFRKQAIMTKINEIARSLKPGQSCSQVLAQEIGKALENVEYYSDVESDY